MQRGFTKLFNTIVTSTIWQEDDKTRIVWITMLAIADAAGIVGASIPGLASVSNVSVNAARAAVKTLLAPDTDSRTKDFDGRRIEEVDGGWRILNHAKYRRMLNEEERKEYKAKWIAEKRRQESTVDKRRQASTPRRRAAIMSTQAEAEAEATKKERGAHVARPQSIDDVLKIMDEKSAHEFWDYYESNGWRVGRNPMKMWKAAASRWIRNKDSQKNGWEFSRSRPKERAPVYPKMTEKREPTEAELANARRIAHEETARFKEQFK